MPSRFACVGGPLDSVMLDDRGSIFEHKDLFKIYTYEKKPIYVKTITRFKKLPATQLVSREVYLCTESRPAPTDNG